MPATVPHSVQKRQPHSVPQSVYRIRMAPPREKELLKRNILRALRLRPGLSDMADKDAVRKLKDLGVIPGNAQRLMDSESSPRLSSIIEASRKLGVSIASLFDPGASDDALSAPAHTPWPFIRLSLEEWEGLEEWQRTLLEDAAMMKMRELRAELGREGVRPVSETAGGRLMMCRVYKLPANGCKRDPANGLRTDPTVFQLLLFPRR